MKEHDWDRAYRVAFHNAKAAGLSDAVAGTRADDASSRTVQAHCHQVGMKASRRVKQLIGAQNNAQVATAYNDAWWAAYNEVAKETV